jgi:ABC-type lipoprotein release transport system permease subunit
MNGGNAGDWNMADREGGGGSSPWIAFLAGIILVAIVAIGIVAYSGGFQRQQEQAELDLTAPDIRVNPPDVDLPEPPPAPQMPPSATPPAQPAPEPAPAEPSTTP